MTILEQIKDNPDYKQIMADSFGGIMYDVANRGKYNKIRLLKLWDSLPANEQEGAGGIMKGAIDFVQGAI